MLIWLQVAPVSSGLPGYLTTGRIGTIPDVAAGVIFSTILGVGIGSLIWTYYASLNGLHMMGAASLHLRPFYEDLFLGLKPVGSLSLSLAGSYFGFLGLLLAGGLTSPDPGSGFYGFVLVFIVSGLLVFFLPLLKLHKVMLEQKAIEKNRLARELAERVRSPRESDVSQVLMLDMMERETSAIHTWPFDLNILGKLTIIALSVTAALLARLTAAALGI